MNESEHIGRFTENEKVFGWNLYARAIDNIVVCVNIFIWNYLGNYYVQGNSFKEAKEISGTA